MDTMDISESNTSETLSKQQKKDWKKRENKMKALLAAMAEKHALRKEQIAREKDEREEEQ